MSKSIHNSINNRVSDVETEVCESLKLTKASCEYMELLTNILNKVDDDNKALIEKLDRLIDPILFYAIRKAYIAGLRDGLKVGEE